MPRPDQFTPNGGGNAGIYDPFSGSMVSTKPKANPKPSTPKGFIEDPFHHIYVPTQPLYTSVLQRISAIHPDFFQVYGADGVIHLLSGDVPTAQLRPLTQGMVNASRMLSFIGTGPQSSSTPSMLTPQGLLNSGDVFPTSSPAQRTAPAQLIGPGRVYVAGVVPGSGTDTAYMEVLRQRFRQLPQPVKDVLLHWWGKDIGGDVNSSTDISTWESQQPNQQGDAMTVNDFLAQLSNVPHGYGSLLTGQEFRLPAAVKDYANNGDTEIGAYLYGLMRLLPPAQQGQDGYYYHFYKPGLAAQIVDPISVFANDQFGGLTDFVVGSLSMPFNAAINYFASKAAPGQKAGVGGQLYQGSTFDNIGSNPVEWWKNSVIPGTNALGQVTDQAGRDFSSLVGMNPDSTDPGVQTGVGIASFILQWNVAGSVGEIGRGFKLAQSVSGYADVIKAQRAAETAGDFEAALAYKQQAGQMLAATSHSPLTQSVYKLLAKTPEELVSTSKSTRVATQLYRDVQAGRTATQLSRAYKYLPLPVADALTAARSPDDVSRLLLSALKGEIGPSVEAMRARSDEISHILSTDTSALSAVDLMNLENEKRLLDATSRFQISPTTPNISRLPATSPLQRIMAEEAKTPLEKVIAGLAGAHVPLPIFSRISEPEVTAAETRMNLAWQKLDELGTQLERAQTVGDGETVARLSAQVRQWEPLASKAEADFNRLADAQNKLRIRFARTSPALSRFWEEEPSRRLWVHTLSDPAMPADALERNIKNVTAYLRRLDVPKAVEDQVLSEFVNAKTKDDWFNARTSLATAAYFSPMLDAREASLIAEFGRAEENQRRIGLVFQDGHSDPTLFRYNSAGQRLHVPAGPEDMIRGSYLPPVKDVIEATGYFRRVLRGLREGGAQGRGVLRLPGRAVATTYDVSSRLLAGFTRFFKQFVTQPRTILHIGPIGQFQMRIIGEELAQASAMGLATPFNWPSEFFSYAKTSDVKGMRALFGEDYQSFLGQIQKDLLDHGGTKVGVPLSSDNVMGRADPGFYEAWNGQFRHRSANGLSQIMATAALNEEDPIVAGKKWLQSKNAGAVAFRSAMEDEWASVRANWEQRLGEPITKQDVIDAHLERQAEELRQLTGDNHPDLLRAFRSGYLQRDLPPEDFARLDGRAAEVQAQIDKFGSRRNLSDFQRADLNGLIAERTMLRKQMDALFRQGKERIEAGSDEFTKALSQMHLGKEVQAPPEIMGQGFRAGAGRGKIARMLDHRYQQDFAIPEMKWARGPVFQQFYKREFERLRSLGWDEASAEQKARYTMAETTKWYMHDLSNRTSANRFFNNIFPFGAAFQLMVERWAWKIPATMLPGVGHLYLAKRVEQIGQLLGAIGINPTQKKALGLGSVISGFLGSPVPLDVTFTPSDANIFISDMVNGGFGPGLGPLPAAALNAMAQHSHIAEVIAKHLNPYGPSINVGPANLTRYYEYLFHKAPPWDALSGDLQQHIWDVSVLDAYREYEVKFRSTMPKESTYLKLYKDDPQKARQEYEAARTKWVAAGHDWAENQAGKYQLVRAVVSSFLPLNIGITDEWKTEASALRDKIAKEPAQAAQLWTDFLKEHPGAALYLAPESVAILPPTRKAPPFADAKAYYAWLDEQIAAGTRMTFTPANPASLQDFTAYGNFLASEQYHYDALDRIQTQYGGGGSPAQQAANILNNYNAYSAAVTDENTKWNAYLGLNKDGYDLRQRYIGTLPSNSQYPARTADQQAVLDLIGTLKDAVPALEAGGLKPQDITKFKGEVNSTIAALDTKFGPATDPVRQQIEWWFSNVFAPYATQTSALYDKLDNLPSTEQGAVFDQIRQLSEKDIAVTHNGVEFPSVQQWRWASMDPADQQASTVKWTLRPTEWLTPFQRGKIGLPDSSQATAFFELANRTQEQLKIQLAQIHGTGSTAAKDALTKRFNDFLDAQALRLGVANEWRFAQAQPFQRLIDTGFGSGNKTWTSLTTAVQQIDGIITRAGLTPGGGSQLDDYYRSWLFNVIDQKRQENTPEGKAFNDLMLTLEMATAPSGQAARVGADMYNAVFFDSWFGANLPPGG